jgi:hypothetical protein
MSSILTYGVVILLFVLFMYYYIVNRKTSMIEQFENINSNCPNVLIEKDGKFYLMNSKKQQIPGVNPIIFENLEDYIEFLEWQRHMGILCPVLYLQKTNNAQGENELKIRPNVLEKQGGLPPVQLTNKLLVDASHDDKPYNKNSYPGFDPSSYYIGETTPLDKMNINEKKLLISPDAMNDNWGGNLFTQKLIDKGYYKGNEVSMYVP